MKILLALILLLLLSTPAHAEWFSWDENNTKLHVPLTILMFADYRQTLYNEKHYYRNNGVGTNGIVHRESNKSLGQYPSRKEIHEYFASVFVACGVIPFILPPEISYFFQGSVITIEVDVVNQNYRFGAKYMF